MDCSNNDFNTNFYTEEPSKLFSIPEVSENVDDFFSLERQISYSPDDLYCDEKEDFTDCAQITLNFINPPIKTENSVEEFYKKLYTRFHFSLNEHSSNYENKNFCDCCRKQYVIPPSELDSFIFSHATFSSPRTKKYLLLVFRLKPFLFPFDVVMDNPFLRQTVYDRTGTNDRFKKNISARTEENKETDKLVYTKYFNILGIEATDFVYEQYFHQPYLTFCDYVKCSICRSNMCPTHYYLSNAQCSKCNFCDKSWVVCGWCKPNFNEGYACKYIHK